MRKFRILTLLAVLTLVAVVFSAVPTSAQNPPVTNTRYIVLALDEFTSVDDTQPVGLPSPITFGPDRANFFTNPALPGIYVQVGHTAPSEFDDGGTAAAQALLDDTLGADATGPAPLYGDESWRTLQTLVAGNAVAPPASNPSGTPSTNDGKTEILIVPDLLLDAVLGGATILPFDVADIQAIEWTTNRSATSENTDNEWYASIWSRFAASTGGAFPDGVALINFEPRYEPGLVATGTTNTYTASDTGATEPFNETNFGFTPNLITLEEITGGPVDWSTQVNSGSTNTVDYTGNTVEAIAFATASAWGYQLDSYIDQLVIELDAGGNVTERWIFDLEQTNNYVEPTIDKAFSPPVTPPSITSQVTYTLTNPNATPLSGATFSDTLTGLTAGGFTTINGTGCSGDVTVAGSTITLTNGILPANSTCEVVTSVFSATAGSYTSTTTALTSFTVPGTDTATATLIIGAPLFDSVPAAPGPIELTGPTGTTATSIIAVSNVGDPGSELDVVLQSISTGYSVTGLPISDLTPAGSPVNLTVSCTVPQTEGTLVVNTDPFEFGNPITFRLTCVEGEAEPTPEPTPDPEPEPEPTTAPDPGQPSTPGQQVQPAQPENLGVTELPATGETPLWARVLRWLLTLDE